MTKYQSCQSLILLTAMLFAPAALVEAGTVSFFDGTFNNADWNNTEILNPGGDASFTAFQVGSGGDPGSFQETDQTFNQTPIDVSHLNPGFTYNPSVQGALTSIDVDYDLIEFSPLHGIEVVYSILLFQNGTYYSPPGGFNNLNQSSWTNFSHTGLTASDFDRDFDGFTLPGLGPTNPNFSSTGGPIEFGFASGNTPLASPALTTTSSGIDNLSITLNNTQPVPEPTSAMLLTGGLAVLVFMKRLRRARKHGRVGCIPPAGSADCI